MSIEVKELDLLHNKKDRSSFINLPWELYKDDENWVPPLKLALEDLLNPKHPFYQTGSIKAWIALKNERPVGRIISVINK